ncbi:MAG: hypothetical protein ACRDRA_14080 [Pseudonocardiaceae bacterium]
MSSFLNHIRNGEGELPDSPDETMAELPEYGLWKQVSDRWNARRDARKGLPVRSKEPEPTQTVKKLFFEFLTLVAAEQERWDQETTPDQQKVAELTRKIKTTKDNLDKDQELLDGWQQMTTNGASGDKLAACRRRDTLRRKDKWDPLTATRRRLGDYQAELEELNAKIASCDKKRLERQKQIAGYSCLRIATYCSELLRIHPHGDRLSTTIKWGLTELASVLERSRELEKLLIKIEEIYMDTEPPEKN